MLGAGGADDGSNTTVVWFILIACGVRREPYVKEPGVKGRKGCFRLASVSQRTRILYTSCGSDGIHIRLLSIFDRWCENEAVPGLEVMSSIDILLFDMETCLIRRSVLSDLDSTASKHVLRARWVSSDVHA
jgi:hypothetical protein